MDLDFLSDTFNEGHATTLGQFRDTSLDIITPALASNSTPSNQTGAVIIKIENIFESIADVLLDRSKEKKTQLTIKLKTRNKVRKEDKDVELDEGSIGGKRKNKQMEFRSVCFPSRNAKEAWKFAALLRILELSHEALVTGVVTTKRDIYYRDPGLFMKQAVVDRYVDDIACTFGVSRDALNVVAAAKGLIAGSFTLKRKDGSTVNYTLEPEGLLTPNSKDVKEIQLQEVQWILVIEKEATFRTLVAKRYWNDSQAGKGIMVTAKGYPDIQTRQFLYFLSSTHPQLSIFALVDYDPDGIGIYSTYKHGSINLAHEINLAVPSIQWLGVRSRDFLSRERNETGMLSLSARDRRIARKMLDRKILGGKAEEWRQELQMMLMLNLKAEIQILGNGEELGEWLDQKITGTLPIDEEMML